MLRSPELIVAKLTAWYTAHARPLPWRETRDPYAIWVSEVILQQTQVERGLLYYERFLAAFPTPATLAAASEDEVLRLWQGLGYYSRARHMRRAAMEIQTRFGGQFPRKLTDLLSLSGVGAYTAAAIAAFAYGDVAAAVDGNVQRVVSRLTAIEEPVDAPSGHRLVSEVAMQLVSAGDPRLVNNALMELGATLCLPRRPLCDACPLRAECAVADLPLAMTLPRKRHRTKVSDRYLYYLYVEDLSGAVALRKRAEGDIWSGLYEFLPLSPAVGDDVELTSPLTDEELLATAQALYRDCFASALCGGVGEHRGAKGSDRTPQSLFDGVALPTAKLMKHVLSHRRLHIAIYACRVAQFPEDTAYEVVPRERIADYAFPVPLASYLSELDAF